MGVYPKRIRIDSLLPELDQWQMGTLAIGRGQAYTDCHSRIVQIDLCTGRLAGVLATANPHGTSLSHLRYVEGDLGDPLLMFTYFQFYDTSLRAASSPSIGRFSLTTGKSIYKYKPFLLNNKVPNLWQRGGTLVWRHQLAAGFGGYYSIFAGGSYGPSLVTRQKALLGYPEAHRAPRVGPVVLPPRSTKPGHNWVGYDPKRWTAADLIGGDTRAGGCIFYHGHFLFFVQLGMGDIRYTGGTGVQASKGWQNYIYSYDYRELEQAEHPWEPQPKIYPIDRDVRGACVYEGRVWVYNWPYIEQIDL